MIKCSSGMYDYKERLQEIIFYNEEGVGWMSRRTQYSNLTPFIFFADGHQPIFYIRHQTVMNVIYSYDCWMTRVSGHSRFFFEPACTINVRLIPFAPRRLSSD